MKDIVIIGSGPAGLSAAINGVARNKDVLIISNDYRNNYLYKTEQIDNYLGFSKVSGKELMDSFISHVNDLNIEMKTARVQNIMPLGDMFMLNLGNEIIEAKSIILSIGVVRNKPYFNEEKFIGQGISYCATCDGMLYRDKNVVVIGLANDSVEEANFLAETGCIVTFVTNKEVSGLLDSITIVSGKKYEIIGDDKLTGVKVDDMIIETEGVFILREAISPKNLLPDLEFDGPYIKVNSNFETNIPGVYAAGDCIGLPLQVSKAVGDGLVAGQNAAKYLDNLNK